MRAVAVAWPEKPATVAFVVEAQADMAPQHRDRPALSRLCGGRFRRGRRLTPTCGGRARHRPRRCQRRSESSPGTPILGNISGTPKHCRLAVSKTLAEDGSLRFVPEMRGQTWRTGLMPAERMRKGLEDLAGQGVVQGRRPGSGATRTVGGVWQLRRGVLASTGRPGAA